MPPSAELPGFLAGVAPILDRWGYLAVAGVIGVESFGVPAPGQTIMVAASIYAGAGRLNIFAVAAIAFISAVLGDNIGYWIGVRGGRRVVHRFGKYVLITPERLERAEKFFARRGNRIVVVARFIDGLRQLNGVIAGITAMPWRTFLLYNAIGAALWVGLWTTVAYLLGTHLVAIIERAHDFKWFAIAGVVLAIAAYAFFHIRHIRRRKAARQAPADEVSADSVAAPASAAQVSAGTPASAASASAGTPASAASADSAATPADSAVTGETAH